MINNIKNKIMLNLNFKKFNILVHLYSSNEFSFNYRNSNYEKNKKLF